MAVVTYNRGADVILEHALSTNAMDLRCALVLADVTGLIDQDLNTVADVDALNAGATNIHTERVAVTGETSTQDDVNNRANFDLADVVFAPAAGVDALGGSALRRGWCHGRYPGSRLGDDVRSCPAGRRWSDAHGQRYPACCYSYRVSSARPVVTVYPLPGIRVSPS